MIRDLNFLNKYVLDSYYNETRISPDFFRKLAFIEFHSSSMLLSVFLEITKELINSQCLKCSDVIRIKSTGLMWARWREQLFRRHLWRPLFCIYWLLTYILIEFSCCALPDSRKIPQSSLPRCTLTRQNFWLGEIVLAELCEGSDPKVFSFNRIVLLSPLSLSSISSAGSSQGSRWGSEDGGPPLTSIIYSF